jgi:Kef-type K+ transport system membrane component KefB
MAAVGPMFGITRMQSIRAGMLLAAGGEFAFVAFGESHCMHSLQALILLHYSNNSTCPVQRIDLAAVNSLYH